RRAAGHGDPLCRGASVEHLPAREFPPQFLYLEGRQRRDLRLRGLELRARHRGGRGLDRGREGWLMAQEGTPEMTEKAGTFDKDLIRELAELLNETGLSEIEIEHEG